MTTSTQQLLSRSSYFFRTAAFLRSSSSRTVTFSQLLFQNSFFFQSKTSTEQRLLANRKLFRAVNLRNSYLFGAGIAQKKEIYRSATFSKQVLLHSIIIFRKATYWKKLIIQKSNTLYYILFLESCLFRAVTFSKDATFYSIYLFRRAAFLQDTFSEELTFHTDLFVSSYVSSS